MKALVTGGCGFIGSALVRALVADGHSIVNVDKLTYASDLSAVEMVANLSAYRLEPHDIVDSSKMYALFAEFQPDAVFHLAAESHVDRSIDGPEDFIKTNLMGTFVLLQSALNYWVSLTASNRGRFRFIHVSTDEVYGSLGAEGLFDEGTAYKPNSPYAASKAGADHLVRAWHRTYGLPTLISNCSNNYGPYQNREKLIPTIIRKAIHGQSIPIYGQGTNVRDWLYVDDHIAALLAIHSKGQPGNKFNIGGSNELSNISLALKICCALDEKRPRNDGRPHSDSIRFVEDRPGHDQRYAIDARKAMRELGWSPNETLTTGLARTIDWYLHYMEKEGITRDENDRLGLQHRGSAID